MFFGGLSEERRSVLLADMERVGCEVEICGDAVGSMWFGILKNERVLFCVAMPGENGVRDWLSLAVRGQCDIDMVLPHFSRFMGFEPSMICRISHMDGDTVFYVWKWNCSETDIEKVFESPEVYDLVKLDKGLRYQVGIYPPEKYYCPVNEIRGNILDALNRMSDMSGTVQLRILESNAMAFLAENGLGVCPWQYWLEAGMYALVVLDRILANEAEIIKYALRPFIDLGLVDDNDSCAIIEWFSRNIVKNSNQLESGDVFIKQFVVKGDTCTILTFLDEGCRCLLLSFDSCMVSH